MTKKKRYRRYSPEFKREALKRASDEGVTDVQVCEELGISARQLRRWRDEFRLLGDDERWRESHDRVRQHQGRAALKTGGPFCYASATPVARAASPRCCRPRSMSSRVPKLHM